MVQNRQVMFLRTAKHSFSEEIYKQAMNGLFFFLEKQNIDFAGRKMVE